MGDLFCELIMVIMNQGYYLNFFNIYKPFMVKKPLILLYLVF